MVGDPESKGVKVAALNLFHPTASPLLRKVVFSYCDTASRGEEIRGCKSNIPFILTKNSVEINFCLTSLNEMAKVLVCLRCSFGVHR